MPYFRPVRNLLYLLLLSLPAALSAQIGGRAVYDFLRLAPAARIAAMGGVNVSIMDDDPNFAAQNPALANDSMHKQATLSLSNYLAGIGYGYAGYSMTPGAIGSLHAGVQYVSYGEMQGADAFGNLTERFRAGETAFIVGMSRGWKGFRYGANLKLISSTLGNGYASWGMAADAGAAYRSPSQLFSAGFVLKNMGMQFTPYVPGLPRQNLPFELQTGITVKPKYMPIRFSLSSTNLEHPQLIYRDPNRPVETDLNGNVIEPKNPWLDNLVRHVVFGGELLIGNALRVRGGYNHLLRQELRSFNRAGMSGFSLGFGLRVSRFAFDYAFNSYGADAVFNTHLYSIRMNLNRPGAKR